MKIQMAKLTCKGRSDALIPTIARAGRPRGHTMAIGASSRVTAVRGPLHASISEVRSGLGKVFVGGGHNQIGVNSWLWLWCCNPKLSACLHPTKQCPPARSSQRHGPLAVGAEKTLTTAAEACFGRCFAKNPNGLVFRTRG